MIRWIALAMLIGLAIGGTVGYQVAEWRRDSAALEDQSKAETDRLARQTQAMIIAKTTATKLARESKNASNIQVAVVRRIAPNTCVLPGDWRVLHDAAAAGNSVDPTAGPGSDASPVDAQTAAATVTGNYEEHRKVVASLLGCQDYIRNVVHPAGLSGDQSETGH